MRNLRKHESATGPAVARAVVGGAGLDDCKVVMTRRHWGVRPWVQPWLSHSLAVRLAAGESFSWAGPQCPHVWKYSNIYHLCIIIKIDEYKMEGLIYPDNPCRWGFYSQNLSSIKTYPFCLEWLKVVTPMTPY